VLIISAEANAKRAGDPEIDTGARLHHKTEFAGL
jgi:hypothetical protein